jgi:hypothetical protein
VHLGGWHSALLVARSVGGMGFGRLACGALCALVGLARDDMGHSVMHVCWDPSAAA